MNGKNRYYKNLRNIVQISEDIPDLGFAAYLKIISVLTINMEYENFAFFNKESNPYEFINPILESQINCLLTYRSIRNIFEIKKLKDVKDEMEQRHKKLFQKLWVTYDKKTYNHLVNLMIERFKNNGLDNSFFKDKICLDVGCGNGRVSIAMNILEAKEVFGIDYGKESIKYAREKAKEYRFKNTHFSAGSAYNLKFPGATFDVVISNGVFHHLDKMLEAIKEVGRVLKSGGFFWLYIQGKGGIYNELWDLAKKVMEKIPPSLTFKILNDFGLTTNKRYHLMDAFYATYIYTGWNEIVRILKREGFENIIRFEGGRPTDFDRQRILSEKYGYEKFGEGEFRIGCYKK